MNKTKHKYYNESRSACLKFKPRLFQMKRSCNYVKYIIILNYRIGVYLLKSQLLVGFRNYSIRSR